MHIALESININPRSYCLFLENALITADLLYNLNLHLHGFPMIKIIYDHRLFFLIQEKTIKRGEKKIFLDREFKESHYYQFGVFAPSPHT